MKSKQFSFCLCGLADELILYWPTKASLRLLAQALTKMESIMTTFCLEVAGDFACFTRPEMKVERVSYEVITPSAARAIFEAILWKPAIRWQVIKIDVLRPIRWVNIRRNEIGAIVSSRHVQKVMEGGEAPLGIYIEDQRQQRAGLFLRDVAYRIHAQLYLQEDSKRIHHFPHLKCSKSESSENNYAKFSEMFKRRASKGQCFNQPYLGTREFSCRFRYISENELTKEMEQLPAISESKALGWMLYDMDFSHPKNPVPKFFNAEMINGTMHVPKWHSEEVRG